MTASNDLDRAVQTQAAVAVRALRKALEMCLEQARTEEYNAARLSRVRRDVLAALGAAERIRTVATRYDADDLDLQPTRPYERRVTPPVVGAPDEEEIVIEDVEVDDGE